MVKKKGNVNGTVELMPTLTLIVELVPPNPQLLQQRAGCPRVLFEVEGMRLGSVLSGGGALQNGLDLRARGVHAMEPSASGGELPGLRFTEHGFGCVLR